MQPGKYRTTESVFKDAKLNITNEDKRHVGAGKKDYEKGYAIMRVNEWLNVLKSLLKIAKFYTQASYWAFTSGLRHMFT